MCKTATKDLICHYILGSKGKESKYYLYFWMMNIMVTEKWFFHPWCLSLGANFVTVSGQNEDAQSGTLAEWVSAWNWGVLIRILCFKEPNPHLNGIKQEWEILPNIIEKFRGICLQAWINPGLQMIIWESVSFPLICFPTCCFLLRQALRHW